VLIDQQIVRLQISVQHSMLMAESGAAKKLVHVTLCFCKKGLRQKLEMKKTPLKAKPNLDKLRFQRLAELVQIGTQILVKKFEDQIQLTWLIRNFF